MRGCTGCKEGSSRKIARHGAHELGMVHTLSLICWCRGRDRSGLKPYYESSCVSWLPYINDCRLERIIVIFFSRNLISCILHVWVYIACYCILNVRKLDFIVCNLFLLYLYVDIIKLFLWVWYGPSILKLVYVYVFSSSWNQEIQIDFKYLLAYTFLDSLYVKNTP